MSVITLFGSYNKSG